MDSLISCFLGENETNDEVATLKILAIKQLLTIIIIISFIAIGAFFCHYSDKSYDELTSVYWAVQTVSTVGTSMMIEIPLACSLSFLTLIYVYKLVRRLWRCSS